MHRRNRFPLWLLPILGTILGIAYAILGIEGFFAPWHFLGKPSENISRIIGFVGGDILVRTKSGDIDLGHRVFVETESGDIYSIVYYHLFKGHDLEWKKEEKIGWEPDPERKPTGAFLSPPLLVLQRQSAAGGHERPS